MQGKDIHKELIEIMLQDEEKYSLDNKIIMDRVESSDATFKGEPVPTLYNPYYVTKEDQEAFSKITQTMLDIIDKVTEEYIDNPDFRAKFLYPKFIEDLIMIDSGYDMNVPVARFDFFYENQDDFSFIELNTDGASCMNEDNTISKIILKSEASKALEEKYDLDYFELFHSWVDKSLELFHRYDPENENPNVAIMDFKESSTMTDFKKFKKAYEDKGYKCKIIDPRDVEYRDGKMYYGNYRIDLVYRRMVTFELIEKKDEIEDFLAAYRDQAFCCIGSLKSQIGHNKIFFKILHDEDTLDLLTKEERDYVKRHVPYTGLFRGNLDVYEKVLNNKDKYIMKPMDMNASQGVFVGRDLDQKNWKKKLDEVWDKDYIYQEFIDSSGRTFARFQDGELLPKYFGVVTGVFLYGGELAGVYSRIGNESIISNVADYYSIPGIKVRKKSKK